MAQNNNQKRERTTLEKYKFWRNWQRGLTAAKFSGPTASFSIVLGLNWNQWVGEEATTGVSIGVGFGMLIVATIAGIIGVWKKDKLLQSKVSGVFYVAIVLAIVGFGFMLLASMINEMGKMFLWVATGVCGSAVIDQISKSKVDRKAAFYEKLVKDNGLDKESAQEMDDADQAKREGEQAKAERRNAEARRRAVE